MNATDTHDSYTNKNSSNYRKTAFFFAKRRKHWTLKKKRSVRRRSKVSWASHNVSDFFSCSVPFWVNSRLLHSYRDRAHFHPETRSTCANRVRDTAPCELSACISPSATRNISLHLDININFWFQYKIAVHSMNPHTFRRLVLVKRSLRPYSRNVSSHRCRRLLVGFWSQCCHQR